MNSSTSASANNEFAPHLTASESDDYEIQDLFKRDIKPLVEAMIDEITERFPQTQILSNLGIFSDESYAKIHEVQIKDFGYSDILNLTDHYGVAKKNLVNPLQTHYALINKTGCLMEFDNFKYFNHLNAIPSDQDPFLPVFASKGQNLFPNMFKLFQIVGTIPVSTVECERGFSRQNLIKTKLRNRLSTIHLDQLLRVAIEG
jgi:hypothetical protein